MADNFVNPYRPGAGHMPPYLAGREPERAAFLRLLDQQPIMSNALITGLRGVGKTVLLDSLKPLAMEQGWAWVGTDMSEAASLTEAALAGRILADLSVVTAHLPWAVSQIQPTGFNHPPLMVPTTLTYAVLVQIYEATPGLAADRLKACLEQAWQALAQHGCRGVLFAYDESQNLTDQASKEQFPLSVLLDSFQSLQKRGYPLLLALSGLPTLMQKLVSARTYAERMFHVMTLGNLDAGATEKAIACAVPEAFFTQKEIVEISKKSGGYPYFVQFICREAFDFRKMYKEYTIPYDEIIRKLDVDFFSGRWARATDRQRDLLRLAAALPDAGGEFTVRELVEASQNINAPFSSSHVSQMLDTLISAGLIFKNRHGRYSFAVPLMADFILRQTGIPA